MDTSTITYSNYQSGFIHNPVSKINFNNKASFAKNTRNFNPVANTNPKENISQTSQISKTTKEENRQAPNNAGPHNSGQLTRAEMQVVEELKQVDTKVRHHEMAHIAAGGRYITSGANFTYTQGPDGKSYAVGGEVKIDASSVPGDPQATIRKMRQVRSAALAPASPSPQDLKVASKATLAASKALSELMVLQAKDKANSNEKKAFGSLKKAAGFYEKINNLPESNTSSIHIEV
ncbi:MAG: SprA-related family protein [Deltaproteobacteria bacterium]|nr:SprA-related family protein [Deltaproteobacteria bacterium]